VRVVSKTNKVNAVSRDRAYIQLIQDFGLSGRVAEWQIQIFKYKWLIGGLLIHILDPTDCLWVSEDGQIRKLQNAR